MAETAIYTRLASDAPLLEGRIYPLRLPQNVSYPAAVYQRVSALRTYTMSGDPLVQPTIQIDIYGHVGAGYEDFSAAVDEVREALERYSDPNSSPPILASFIETERDDYEDETELYRKSYDLQTAYVG